MLIHEALHFVLAPVQTKNRQLTFKIYPQVFSGYDDSGQSYGRFCGNKLPPEIISVDEALLLRFKSDDTINSKGFSAKYVITDNSDKKDYDYFEVEKPRSY